MPCPGCGACAPDPIWRYDRYFFRVDLSLCTHCSLIYLARGLSGEAEQQFYANFYPRIMGRPNIVELARFRMLAGYRLQVISNVIGTVEDVLDLGAGTGFFLDACRSLGCRRFVGIEPGQPQARHAIEVLGLKKQLLVEAFSEQTRLPFEPRIVTLFHVLEHLENPGATLRVLQRQMAEDGWLVVEVPDILADWHRLGLIQVHVSHRSYFCARTLTDLLQNNGFRVQYISREAEGVYPGNLRIFARRMAQQEACESLVSPPNVQQRELLKRYVRSQISTFSLRNGYPRAAIRLLRRAFSNEQKRF